MLDYDDHRAEVFETIVYPNRTGIPLTHLVLAIEANFWPGAFNLASATVGGVPVSPVLEEQYMEVQLPQVLEPDAATTLSLQFMLDIPVLRDPALGERNLTTSVTRTGSLTFRIGIPLLCLTIWRRAGC